jgi:hypothetical protein
MFINHLSDNMITTIRGDSGGKINAFGGDSIRH